MQENQLPPPGAPDIDIARAAHMAPILPLAQETLGIAPEHLVPYGHHKAKLSLELVKGGQGSPARQADPCHRDHADACG
jgi:formate--tetrahydrofolate ligase